MRVLSVNVGVPREVSWTGPIATAIVLLASDMGSYVNGAVIPVDGGHIAAAAGVYQSRAKEPA